jgi:hypothetical protein
MTLTITLEGEDAARVTAEAHRRGVEPDDVVRESLRKTLPNDSPQETQEPFVISGSLLRARPGLNFDDIEGLLDEVDGPYRRQ